MTSRTIHPHAAAVLAMAPEQRALAAQAFGPEASEPAIRPGASCAAGGPDGAVSTPADEIRGPVRPAGASRGGDATYPSPGFREAEAGSGDRNSRPATKDYAEF